MPCIRSKTLQRDCCALPLLGCEIEDAPGIAVVICLPGEVVGIAVRSLLTLEFDRLGCVCILSGHEQIEVVTEIADRILNRGLLDEVIAAGVSRAAIHIKVSRRSAEAGVRDALSHVVVRALSGAADVATTATCLPSRLSLKAAINNCARGIRAGGGRRNRRGHRSRRRCGVRARR